MESEPDTAYGFASYRDTEVRDRILRRHMFEKLPGIVYRIGMRESISQVEPDFSIVRTSGQGRRVSRDPVPDLAPVEFDKHDGISLPGVFRRTESLHMSDLTGRPFTLPDPGPEIGPPASTRESDLQPQQ
jgi:hypothetical protein